VELNLDDLTREVAERIRRSGVRQGNGQVSALPDQRTLRYYTTIGLLDRPLAVRGRQAVYGPRHVLQAVAVKRLQAAGMSLGEIQTRLAGLPTAQLAELADADLPAAPRDRWWAAAAAAPSPPAGSTAPEVAPLTMTAIPLGGAVTLLVPTDRRLTASELAAIRDAAAPLTAQLAAAGLAHPDLDEDEKERP
jgi:DNA-binding transcriptional MerR regulator